MYKAMFVYPWDLLDEGVDRVLRRLAETGLNTVALTGSYHAGKFIRPHAPKSRVFFPEDGTVYFRPHLDRYRETPLRPLMSRLLEGDDPFTAATSQRAETGMDVAAWMVCLHNTRLGMAHPEYVTRNAYGDPYYYSLCPSHPEVQAYVLALLSDLASSHEIQYVVLETPGFLPYEHGFHHEFSLVEANPWTSLLLAVCFCPRCGRAADERGIDAVRLAASVREKLDDFFQNPLLPRPSHEQGAHWVIADLVHREEFAAYLRMRMDLVTVLVGQIREALPRSVRLSVIPSVNQPLALAWLEGSDLTGLAEAADAVEVLGYRADPEEFKADLWWARRKIGEAGTLHVALRPAHPDTSNEGNLTTKVQAAMEAGAVGLSFYNYGHIRDTHLGWVARALQLAEVSSSNLIRKSRTLT